MTPEQNQSLIDLSAPLVAEPLPWTALDAEQRAVFRLLMPAPSFTQEQLQWLSLWWLPVTQPQLDALNALCPPERVLEGRPDAEGTLFLAADVLSDALDGGPLSALLPVLETLPLTYLPAEAWPAPPITED